MTLATILRGRHFKEVAEIKADSKNRIALGRKVSHKERRYRIYENDAGQLILDPLATIPAHEAWLFRNKKAAASVARGLEDAKHRRLVKAQEDFSKYIHKNQ